MTKRLSSYASLNESWELHQSAVNLTQYACMVSSRHIKDGALRGQFNRDMAYYVRQILEDVRSGKIRTEDALKQIEAEHKSFARISLELGGVAAGTMMVVTGAGVCYASAATLCAIAGAPMIAHGANNIYENVSNLSTGLTDAVGPLKKIYQRVAIAAGGNESDGNVAYGGVDVSLSMYGFLRPVPKSGTWQLFRPIRTDYIPAYKLMNKGALLFEAVMSGWTANQTYEETKK